MVEVGEFSEQEEKPDGWSVRGAPTFLGREHTRASAFMN